MHRHPRAHGLFGIAVATASAGACRLLHLPLPYILGALAGSALYTNIFGPIRRAKLLRRGGQLVLGAAVGALLTADVVSELLRLLPVMIAMAVSLNAAIGSASCRARVGQYV